MLKNSLPSIPLLQDVSDYARKWSEAGAQPVYDTAFASAIGGYPAGSVLQSADGSGFWISTADNNQSDPDGAAPSNWEPHVFHGVATIAVGAVDVVLQPKDYAKPNLVISGALSADVAVVLPSLVRQWVIQNETVGAHQVTVKTASGQGVVLRPGSQMVWGDGSNILLVTPFPVVSGAEGHYAQWSANGGLEDSHQSASNASNAYVVTSPGSLPVGHIAKIADANGSIGDGGALGSVAGLNASNASNAYAVTSPGSLPVGHIAKIADANGSIGDGGALGSVAGLNASNVSNAYAVTSPGSLPVGHIAKIADANGSIGDGGALGSVAGLNASNASNAYAVTSPGSLPVGHIAKIADANGSIGDGGALGSVAGMNASNTSNAYAVTSPGSLPVGHIAKIADANGSIGDGGALGSAAGLNASSVAAGAGLSSVYSFSGNPNGHVAGQAAVVGVSPPDLCWDTAEQILWTCTLSGTAANAVWQKVGGADPVVPLSADHVVSTQDHSVNFVATAAVSVTLPQANSIPNGACAFSLSAQGGAVTITPAAADSIVVGQNVLSAGASYVLAQGASTFVVSDGAGKWYLLSLSGPGLQPSAFRNRIINGGMKVAQRGTSATITTVNSNAYTVLDRFVAYQTPTANFAFSQVSLPLGLFPLTHCAKIQRTAGSPNTSIMAFGQAIASVNCRDLAGQKVTFSFYACAGANFSPANGQVTAWLYSGTGTDQPFSVMATGLWTGQTWIYGIPFEMTQTLTRYDFTCTVPANASQLGFQLVWTPTGTAGADDTLYITGVQLEQGATVTPFEGLPYDVDLQRCLPYFETGMMHVKGYVDTATNGFWGTRSFCVPKRVVPTIGLIVGLTRNCGPVSVQNTSTDSTVFYATGSAPGECSLQTAFTASAEL